MCSMLSIICVKKLQNHVVHSHRMDTPVCVAVNFTSQAVPRFILALQISLVVKGLFVFVREHVLIHNLRAPFRTSRGQEMTCLRSCCGGCLVFSRVLEFNESDHQGNR